MIGVGRGADLLIYLLTSSFLIFAALVIQKFRNMNRVITKLVSQIAISKGVQNPDLDRQ
jgi:hypothetical protein